jgi:hypothetical protein
MRAPAVLARTHGLSGTGSSFIDLRYRRIETSEPTELIPLKVGFRF